MGKYSSRYKPVGWQGESHRHYLAAKGIKTRKYLASSSINYGDMSSSSIGDPSSIGSPMSSFSDVNQAAKGNKDRGGIKAAYADGKSKADLRMNPQLAQAYGVSPDQLEVRSERKYPVRGLESVDDEMSMPMSSPVETQLPTQPFPEEMSEVVEPAVEPLSDEEQVASIEEPSEGVSRKGMMNTVITPGVPPSPIEGARLL